MNLTPPGALSHHATTQPDTVAFVHGDDIWTYERFSRQVHRLAHGLMACGVRKGCRVALHMANLPELAVAYYACFFLGVIAAPLNIRFKAAELHRALEHLRPSLYIGQASLYGEVAATPHSVLPPKARYIVRGAVDDPDVRYWMDLLQHGWDEQVRSTLDSQQPAALICTSGTTGEPKFVAHTLMSIAETARLFQHLGIDSSQVAVLAFPMVHASGFNLFHACITHGARIVLLDRFDADATLDAIERQKVTWFGGLPFMAAALVDCQRERSRDVGSLRTAVTGGDVCPAQLQGDFRACFGTPLRSAWAATEAVGSLTFSSVPGPVSRVTPGAEVRLVNEKGEEAGPRGTGELQVRGPNVTIGYWESPNVIKDATRDGWFSTGDLMRRDENENLWFVARKKDLIVRGGSNIAPGEVEGALLTHPAVDDAGVAGMPDEVLGERVVGFVCLADKEGAASLDEILCYVRSKLAEYKVPERLEVVSEIPRNGIGKIDRKALLKMI
jgi:long-chain acyl-CoA synthetase